MNQEPKISPDHEKADTGDRKMKCEDIRAVLFDYMTRELGSARSDLVREHLRKCENCQAAVAEIRTTLELLHSASETETGIPDHLSQERRERIIWALTHPIMDWIERHHIIVSIIVAIVVIMAVFSVLRRIEVWKTESSECITVTIGHPQDKENPEITTNIQNRIQSDKNIKMESDLPGRPERSSRTSDTVSY